MRTPAAANRATRVSEVYMSQLVDDLAVFPTALKVVLLVRSLDHCDAPAQRAVDDFVATVAPDAEVQIEVGGTEAGLPDSGFEEAHAALGENCGLRPFCTWHIPDRPEHLDSATLFARAQKQLARCVLASE